MEPCTANKNQGLREGYKWLVRSIIAKLDILGPRVEADVEDERLRENERKIAIRKRIEERKRLEGGADEAGEDSNGETDQMPGDTQYILIIRMKENGVGAQWTK